MSAQVTCPSCAMRFARPDDASANLQCPSCGQTFRTDSTAFGVAQAILGGLGDEPQQPNTPSASTAPTAQEGIHVPDPNRPLTFEPERSGYRTSPPRRDTPIERDGRSLRLPPPEPAGGNGKGWTAGISTVVVIGLIVLRGCAAFMRNQPDVPRPVAFNPPPNFKFNDLNIKPFQMGRGALQPQWDPPILFKPPAQTKEQREREIRELVASLQGPIRDQQHTLVSASFDWNRFRDRLEKVGELNQETTRDPQFLQSVVNALERDFFITNLSPWTEMEVRNIQTLPSGDAVGTVRIGDGKGNFWLDRWHFSRQTGTWKFFDVEYLDSGNSLASSILSAPEITYPDPAARQSMWEVDQAIRLLNARKLEDGEQHLNKVVGRRLKGRYPTLHTLAQAQLHLFRQQYPQANDLLKSIADKNDDIPSIDYFFGFTLNRLNSRDALVPLERFHAISGDDALICFEMGEANRLATKFTEAAVLYRKSLDVQPRWGGTFLSLIRSLRPEDDRDDIARRFEKLDKRDDNFRVCAEDCRNAKDWESLEPIARTMDRLTPGHATAPAYLAVALAGLGKTDEATVAFKRIPGLHGGPIGVRDDVFWFIDEMTNQGKGHEAYAAIPDAKAMIPQLLVAAKKTVHPDQIRMLAAEHGKKHPNDPYIKLCKAESLAAAFEDQAADKLFTETCKQPLDPGVVGAFRPTRVAVRYRLGQAVSAYKEIGPRHETFSQLQLLCTMNKDEKTLDEIVDLHVQNEPTDPLLVNLLRMRLLKKGKVEEALAPVLAELERVNDPLVRMNQLRPFLHSAVDADVETQVYAKMPDSIASDAFNLLGFYLTFKNPGRVQALIDAHRKRMPNDPTIAKIEAALAVRANDHAKAAEKFLVALKAKDDPGTRDGYLLAAANSGQAVEALKQVKGSSHDLGILGRELASKKKWDDLDKLLKAFAPEGSDDATYLGLRARRLIGGKDWERTEAALLKYKQKSNNAVQADEIFYSILDALLDAGRALPAYKVSPNRSLAFESIGRWLTAKKRPDELAKLLDEHRKNFPRDVRLTLFDAELKLLRNDPDGAIQLQDFKKSRQIGANQLQQHAALNRAYLAKGNIKSAYEKAGRNGNAFRSLGDELYRKKKPDDLERLIAVHRDHDPDDPELSLRTAHVKYLRGDYAGVVQQADAWLKDRKANHSPISYLRVRALIHLKKYDEALKETEARSATEVLMKPLHIFALAKKGDTAAVVAVMEKWSHEDVLFVNDCWLDPELAGTLREPRFADLRDRFPDRSNADRFLPDED